MRAQRYPGRTLHANAARTADRTLHATCTSHRPRIALNTTLAHPRHSGIMHTSIAKRLFNVRTYNDVWTAADANRGGHHLRTVHRLQTPSARPQALTCTCLITLTHQPRVRLCFSETCSEERPYLQDGTAHFGARSTATAARASAYSYACQRTTLYPGELATQHGPPDCGTDLTVHAADGIPRAIRLRRQPSCAHAFDIRPTLYP